MKIIIALALLSFSLVSHADVIIYSQTVKMVVTGQYATFTTNVTGYVVLSTAYGASVLDADAKHKTFHVTTSKSYRVRYVRSSATKQLAVFATTLDEDIGSNIIKGTVGSLNVGTADNFSAPFTMTVRGGGMSGSNPLAVLTEYTGVMAFDARKTILNNQAGNDTAATVNYLRGLFVSKGYTEN
jgi:hypothetical protein